MSLRAFNLSVMLLGAALAVLPAVHARPVVRSVGTAPVLAVRSAGVADLVVLGDGFSAGLRQGMVCRVARGGTAIADILLVELRSGAATALILDLAPGQSIRPGDTAEVKTRQL